ESGTIAGSAETSLNALHAVLWVDGVIRDIGIPSGEFGAAFSSVNDAGQACGSANAPAGQTHAFWYDGFRLSEIGTLGVVNSQANGINASGQICGSSTVPGELSWHAYLYTGGAFTDLGLLANGTSSYGQAVNDAGTVVGACNVQTQLHGIVGRAF